MPYLIAGAAVLIAAGVVLYHVWPLDVGAWPTYEAFRCRECAGPVSIDPHCPERWACRSCSVVSFRIHRDFRQVQPSDLGSVEACVAASQEAGAMDLKPGCPWAVWHGLNL